MQNLTRHIFIILILSGITLNTSFAQKISPGMATLSEIIPQEKVFIHYNKSFLLTGEQLLYKIYCINTATKKLSEQSKVAYVTLIGSDRTIVFKHKIRLEDGIGQGDFFIPASIDSGNYKLIAYTQWMRNGEESSFFQSDVSIVNPFNENQQVLFETEDSVKVSGKKEFELANSNDDIELERRDQVLSIKVDADKYQTRKKVSITIKSLAGRKAFGNYSISVKKKDALSYSNRPTAATYNFKASSLQKKTHYFLPELRGELLKGNVYYNGTENPVKGIKLALSIQGQNDIFNIATTNESGTFYFNISQNYNNHVGSLRVLIEGDFDIILDTPPALQYKNLAIDPLVIPMQEKEVLLNRSINNQIENAYINLKTDKVASIVPKLPFHGVSLVSYDLDDYTRFPTFQETVVEILDMVFLRLRNGKRSISIPRYKDSYYTGYLPLILIDGIMVKDQEALLKFNAKKINTIDVIREKHIYGGQRFEGLMSIKTFDGSFKGFESDQTIKTIELFTPQQQKSYYYQEYINPEKSVRIPDFRSQLYWNPDFDLNTDSIELEFYTSDNEGKYEVTLEGFAKNGTPVSLKKEFKVELN